MAERERKRAKERMTLGEVHTGSEAGKTRDKLNKISKSLGMSGQTLERARAIVEAAKAEPTKYGYLLEDMDKSGKVNGAYQDLKNNQKRAAYEARAERGGRVSDLFALAKVCRHVC